MYIRSFRKYESKYILMRRNHYLLIEPVIISDKLGQIIHKSVYKTLLLLYFCGEDKWCIRLCLNV